MRDPRGGYGGPPPRGVPPRFEPRPGPSLPYGDQQKGYFDEKGHLLPQFICEWARDIAVKLHQERLATAQLRRFFGEVRRLERRLEVTGDFEAVKPELLKLCSYANSAVNKNKAPALFRDFIERNLKWAAQGPKHFKDGFVNHFECIVGFFPETSGNR